MKRISKHLDAIRNEIESRSHWPTDDDQFFSLLAGIDTAEDAAEALLNYEEQGLGSSDGEKYLRLYGFLQGVFLQQDAIKQVSQHLMPPSVKAPPNSAWSQLRELRNMTVGHPTAYGRDQSNMQRVSISRITISDDGFQYQAYDKAKSDLSFIDAGLRTLYDDYKREAQTLLENVLGSLRSAPNPNPHG
jgi:hypothetical protein